MVEQEVNKKGAYASVLIKVILAIVFLIAFNVIAHQFKTRFDLTQDGRYSLSEPTKKMLAEADDIIYIKVFLEGEFPAGMKRLRNAVQDMLIEFKAEAGNQIQYSFVDPLTGASDEQKQAIVEQLVNKGIMPRRLVEQEDSYSEKIIFPSALISYKNRSYPVTLLMEQMNLPPLEVINNSIALLEFQLASTIQKILRDHRPSIAFLEGQGELNENQVADFAASMAHYYEIARLNVSNKLSIPSKHDALIIAKPRESFDEKDKFKIDQYIMNGGRVLWMIDQLRANLDSLNKPGNKYLAGDYGLNLDDQLFKYGIRINYNLVQDIQCSPVPLVVGVDKSGNATQQQLYSWVYYPVATQINKEHPITKSMDAVQFKFASSIDTIRSATVRKDVLVKSSPYSKEIGLPAQLTLENVREKPNPANFKPGNFNLAVALEGTFESVFKNRLTDEFITMLDTLDKVSFQEKSKATKMIVISDGDIMANAFDRQKNQTSPLGYYPFTRQTFANKDFLLNCVEWLLDDHGIIESRTKEVQMRLLDKNRIEQEKTNWQIFNIVIPLLLLLISSVAYHFWRRRKYS